MVCMGLLARQKADFLPLFIDYGQRNKALEYESLRSGCARLGVRAPAVADLSGFGRLVRSGLTDPSLDVVADAFTPNRNLLFVLVASAVAYQRRVSKIVLGLLSEATAIFPDQTDDFLRSAESLVSKSLGVPMEIVAPLRHMYKAEVVEAAKVLGITSYYSCHAGGTEPCGECIACREYISGGP